MAKKRVAKKPTKGPISTTSELRTTLLETIQSVRAGDIDHRQGSTVATLAKTVIASAKLDLEVLRFHQTLESGGLDTEPKVIQLSK